MMDISEFLNNPQKLEEIFEEALIEEDEEIVKALIPYIKEPIYLFEALRKGLADPSPEIENILAQDPRISLKYAWVFGRRFKEGEDQILRTNLLPLYITHLKKINKLNEFYKDYPEYKGAKLILDDDEFNYLMIDKLDDMVVEIY